MKCILLSFVICLAVFCSAQQKVICIGTGPELKVFNDSRLPGFRNSLGYRFNPQHLLSVHYVINFVSGIPEAGVQYSRTFHFYRSKWSISGNIQSSWLKGKFRYNEVAVSNGADPYLYNRNALLFAAGPSLNYVIRKDLELRIGADAGAFTSFSPIQEAAYTSAARKHADRNTTGLINAYISLKYSVPAFPIFKRRK
jgi:hypothetical protein